MYAIDAIRTVPSEDQTHEHVDLVGYMSPHTPGEPIMIPISRVLQKIAFGEKFWIVVEGNRAEVSAGKCPACGHEPYLESAADASGVQRLLELPRK